MNEVELINSLNALVDKLIAEQDTEKLSYIATKCGVINYQLESWLECYFIKANRTDMDIEPTWDK